MLQKLRRAMVDPDRSLLEYLVEVDESDIPYRTKADPVAGGQGRSQIGKLHIIGAIELSPDGLPRRIRLAPLRHGLDARRLTWTVGIPGHQKVYPCDVRLVSPIAGRGRPRKRHVPDQLSVPAKYMLEQAKWRRLS